MPDHARRTPPQRTPMHVMQRKDDLVVLCSDGTFWAYGSQFKFQWVELPRLPQPEAARVEWTERFTLEEASALEVWLDGFASAEAISPLGHALKRLSDIFTALTNDSDVCRIEVEPQT